jgi:hypothetical protein
MKNTKATKPMNALQFENLLIELNACSEARDWAKGKSFAQVWRTCKRGDWLLWLIGKQADKAGWPTRKQVVLAACACAETALKYVPKGEDRPRKAIETARKWARGKATLGEVRDAAAAASAASAASASAVYAAFASAAYAAYAASASAASAAYAARPRALSNCATLVRKMVPRPKAGMPCA